MATPTPAQSSTLPIVSTRTRQDLINSGEAFKMNEMEDYNHRHQSNAYPKASDENKSSGKRRLNECCYSTSNLILIVAAIIGLVVLVKFIQDDPLYNYGEYLLSLNFYRQLIYIIVVLPLVLLVPIFNALSAIFLNQTNQLGKQTESIYKLKLVYEVLLFILVLIGLIFVAPYIRASNLSSQLELEFRKHMKYRYEKQFSYEFLDRIQEAYECCDELWYRANMNDQLPISCFVPDTNFSQIYDQTCANALGSLVSIRCSIISACLLIILVCLASLFSIDLIGLLDTSSFSHPNRYSVNNAQTAQQHQRVGSFQRRLNEDENEDGKNDESANEPLRAHESRPPAMIGGRHDPINELLRKENSLVFNNRLERQERDRQVPLLSNQGNSEAAWIREENRAIVKKRREDESLFEDIDSFSEDNEELSTEQSQPIVLARANLKLIERDQSQSPIFETRTHEFEQDSSNIKSMITSKKQQLSTSAIKSTPIDKQPIKSALKKTSTNQQIDQGLGGSPESGSFLLRNDSQDADADADADSLDEYAEKLRQSNSLMRQKSLQREQPTRRSLLSVRFADE